MTTPGNGTSRPRLSDAGVHALAALVCVGLLLVLAAVTGGAIVWLRFWSAELPAERVLVVTPKADLVAIGAAALAAFALAGVAAVLLAYLIDRCGRPTGESIVSLTVLAVIGMWVAAGLAGGSEWRRLALAAGALAIGAGALAVYLFLAPWRTGRPTHPAGIAAIAGLVILGALALWLFGRWWLGLMLAVAAALVALDLMIARATGDRFRWYGAAVFGSVAVFGAVLAASRTYAEPHFQTAVLLRESDPEGGGIAAIYVTETDDRVYLGQVETGCVAGRPGDRPTPGSGRLFWVPREDVAALAIGRPKPLDSVIEQAPALLAELEPLRLPSPAPPSAPPAAPPAPSPALPPPAPPAQPPSTGPGGATTPAAVTTPTPPPAPAPTPQPLPGRTRRLLGFVASVCKKPATPPFHGELVTGDEALKLASDFRPWLKFDGRELWRPISVDALVHESFEGRDPLRHRVCIGEAELQASCRDASDVADLIDAAAGTDTPERRANLDINGLAVADYCAPTSCGQPTLDCGDCTSSAIYYRVQRANDRVYIDYWWFLRFNHVDPSSKTAAGCIARHKRKFPRCFDHEGDWEGITVVTTVRTPYKLEFASFAEHDRITRYERASLELIGERPVVYVARGTHAAYPSPCPEPPTRKRSCKQSTTIVGIALPEGRHDGLGVWGRNTREACEGPPRCLLPFPSELADIASPWNRWEGSWGSCHRVAKRCVLGGGPESPSNQRRYQNPSCFGTKNTVVCDPVIE